MKRILLAFAGLAAVLVAAPAQAYWEYGHQTIGEIGYANASPKARAAVRRILSHAALLDTPGCPASTVEGAAVWADCIKSIKGADDKSKFGYAYGWHFQDVEICEPFTLADACKDGNCVAAQITRDVALLREPKTSMHDRVQALAFLIHFVGDLHQPLHAGEKHDKGGNDVHAVYGGAVHTNLHAIWDGYLAERAISSGPSLVRRYPAAVRRDVAAGDVTDWSRESWQVAHDDAYGSVMTDPCAPTPAEVSVDEPTIERLIPVARLEVERGGLRLAKLLDAALG